MVIRGYIARVAGNVRDTIANSWALAQCVAEGMLPHGTRGSSPMGFALAAAGVFVAIVFAVMLDKVLSNTTFDSELGESIKEYIVPGLLIGALVAAVIGGLRKK